MPVTAQVSYEAFEAISSVVIAAFDPCGRLLHGNAGLRRITTETPLSLWQLLTQPLPDSILAVAPDSKGRIYAGLLTVCRRDQSMITLTGTIYREAGRLLLIAGYDMNEFDALSAAMLELNNEINKAYSDLARSNRRLAAREREIREMSLTDALTGVGNRRRLDELLVAEIDRATRHALPLSLVILDVDHFKRINDSWGHETGDRVLKEMGTALRGIARKADFVTRMGGEEFVVLMPGTGLSEAVACAERFRATLETWRFDVPTPVTSSLGVACLSPGESGAALLARADAALYAAKQGGRNTVVAAGGGVAV